MPNATVRANAQTLPEASVQERPEESSHTATIAEAAAFDFEPVYARELDARSPS